MAKNIKIKERGTDVTLYPETSTEQVYDSMGQPLDSTLSDMQKHINSKQDALNTSEDLDLTSNLLSLTDLAKKRLFVDMWNDGAQGYGSYNEKTGFFELNGLTDITYEEALLIHRESSGSNFATNYVHCYSRARTFYPMISSRGNFGNDNANYLFYSNSKLEVVRFNQSTYDLVGSFSFGNCPKLKAIYASLIVLDSKECFANCVSLTDVYIKIKANLIIKYSSKLSVDSVKYMISNALNTVAITITVHPDVYAKLTGDTTNAAAAALTPEEAAQWQQLVADAAAKQITFVTV